MKLWANEHEREITKGTYESARNCNSGSRSKHALESQRESLEGPTKHLLSKKESDCSYLLREKLLLAIY